MNVYYRKNSPHTGAKMSFDALANSKRFEEEASDLADDMSQIQVTQAMRDSSLFKELQAESSLPRRLVTQRANLPTPKATTPEGPLLLPKGLHVVTDDPLKTFTEFADLNTAQFIVDNIKSVKINNTHWYNMEAISAIISNKELIRASEEATERYSAAALTTQDAVQRIESTISNLNDIGNAFYRMVTAFETAEGKRDVIRSMLEALGPLVRIPTERGTFYTERELCPLSWIADRPLEEMKNIFNKMKNMSDQEAGTYLARYLLTIKQKHQ